MPIMTQQRTIPNISRQEKPPTFCKGMDAEDWWQQFEAYANRTLANEDDRTWINNCLNNMEHQVRTALRNRESNGTLTLNTVEDLRNAFLQRHGDKTSQQEYLSKFFNVVQTDGEQIEEFYDKLLGLASKAFIDATPELREGLLKNRLETAIRPETLARLTRPYPQDINEFVQLVRKCEQDEKNTHRNNNNSTHYQPWTNNGYPLRTTTNQMQQQSGYTHAAPQATYNTYSANTAYGTQTTPYTQPAYNTQSYSQNYPPQHNQHKNAQSRQQTKQISKCFNCDQPGHWSRECPTRNSQQGTRQAQQAPQNTVRIIRANEEADTEPKIRCKLQGTIKQAVVDTASDISLINEATAKELGLAIMPSYIKVAAANGNQITISGTSLCSVKTKNTNMIWRLIVSREVDGVILGRDWLNQNSRDGGIENWAEQVKRESLDEETCDTQSYESLDELLEAYKDIFGPVDEKGCTAPIVHDIELMPNAKPVSVPCRNIPFKLRAKVNEQVWKLQQRGILQPSKSPWAAGAVIRPKKNGDIRLCGDYKPLNKVTIKDSYGLTRMDTASTLLRNAVRISVCDMQDGFFQIPLSARARPLTAIRLPNGLWESTRMSQGLTGAPSTFSRVMDATLGGYINVFALAYLDDLIIWTYEQGSEQANDRAHIRHLQLVFERLREVNLKLKLEKCQFMKKDLTYLGLNINGEGAKPSQTHVEKLTSYKQPTTLKQLRGFLGFTGFYRKFIKNYGTIARPLVEATLKQNVNGNKIKWNDECEKSFQELKRALTSDTMILHPDVNGHYRLHTDGSAYGIGATLEQESNGSWKPVGFFSKHLNKAQQCYSATQREMLAIVSAVQYFRPYLYGQTFDIYCDHEPIKYMDCDGKRSELVNRWLAELENYSYTIHYRRGKDNQAADGLSRMPNEPEADLGNEAHDDYNDEHEQQIESRSYSTKMISLTRMADFITQDEQEHDEDLKVIIEAIKEQRKVIELKTTHSSNKSVKRMLDEFENFEITNGLLYRNTVDKIGRPYKQLVIPKKRIPDILTEMHDSLWSGGHWGIKKTQTKIKERFFWTNMTKQIKEYVRSCRTCAEIKAPPHYNRDEMRPITTQRPWQLLCSDHMGPLKETKRKNKYILVFIDHTTKWATVFATKDKTAETTAKCFKEVIMRHGIPESLLTDQAKTFESDLYNQILEMADVKKIRTTAWRPQTDGLSEALNKTLLHLLKAYASEEEDEWDEKLNQITFAYNTTVQFTTGMTPFEALYGRKAKVPIDFFTEQPNEQTTNSTYNEDTLKWRDEFKRIYKQIEEETDAKVARQKLNYDRKVRCNSYELGDFVMLLDKASSTQAKAKLKRAWIGPYKITKKINSALYEIKKTDRSKAKIVNVALLKSSNRRPRELGNDDEQREDEVTQTQEAQQLITNTTAQTNNNNHTETTNAQQKKSPGRPKGTRKETAKPTDTPRGREQPQRACKQTPTQKQEDKQKQD